MILIGVDVCHMKKKGKSVVGFISSYDKQFKLHAN